MAGVWARAASDKKLEPLRIFATIEASNFKFGTQLGFGTRLPKNNVLDQNWQGSWPGEPPKKFGTPYLFLQPLKLATSNLLCNLGFGLAYQKTTFRTKIGGAWASEASEKIGTPYVFLQPTEKFVHNRFTLPNTRFRTKLGRV